MIDTLAVLALLSTESKECADVLCVWAEIVVRTFFLTTDLCVVIIKEKANLCLMTTVVRKNYTQHNKV